MVLSNHLLKLPLRERIGNPRSTQVKEGSIVSISQSCFVSSFVASGSLHMINIAEPGNMAAILGQVLSGTYHSSHHRAGHLSPVLVRFQPAQWGPSLDRAALP
jgi:hypothetical protein